MTVDKKPIITGEHFYRFSQCPHWLWHDIYSDSKKRKEIPPLVDMIYRGGIKHKDKAIQGKPFDEIDEKLRGDLDEAFMATLELMKKGKNIYRGVLLHENWVGMPDLLEARPLSELGMSGARSRFGDFYYVAYDIKDSISLDTGAKFQLVFYNMILEQIQGILPREAYVINGDGEEFSFFIQDYAERFHLTLEQITKILEGEKPAPFLKSGCKKSPWYSICLDETKSCNDVSLVYSITQSQQRELYEIGIKTIEDLAKQDINELYKNLSSWNFDRLVRIHTQAQVLVSGEPIVLKKIEFPKVRYEVYFDIESDPTEGLDYLFGFWVKDTESKSEGEYKYFLAKNKGEEEKMWKEFLGMIDSLDDFVIYHYAFYERMVFNRLAKRYGASWDTIRKFNDNTLDLFKYVTESTVLPIYSYGLKDIAKLFGYKWAAEDAGGAESVMWFNEWQEKGDNSVLEKIIKYNRDDVKATMVVKEWVEKQKPHLKNEIWG